MVRLQRQGHWVTEGHGSPKPEREGGIITPGKAEDKPLSSERRAGRAASNRAGFGKPWAATAGEAKILQILQDLGTAM